MPPSGYSHRQAETLTAFLESCAEALEAEATDRREPIAAALSREVSDIAGYEGGPTVSGAQSSVLRFTRDFYERLAAREDISEATLTAGVDDVLSEIRREILEIKI